MGVFQRYGFEMIIQFLRKKGGGGWHGPGVGMAFHDQNVFVFVKFTKFLHRIAERTPHFKYPPAARQPTRYASINAL